MRHDPARPMSIAWPSARRRGWRAVTRRRRPRPGEASAPRRAELDRALREMLQDCPVPESLIDFIENLGEDETTDETAPRRKADDG